jgi:ribosomal protein S18 acetylase RimI-like enzyme
MSIKITKAKRRDLAEISRILREEYGKHPYHETWTKKTALARIKDFFKWHETYVAKENNEILGFVITEMFMWGDKERGMIDELVISSSHQSKGVGTKLMNYAEVALKREGAKNIVLSAHKKAKALDFYKKRGYKIADYVEMEKDL